MRPASTCFAIAAILVFSAVGNALAGPKKATSNPLQAQISAIADLPGAVEVTITNTGRQTARIPKWDLPSEDTAAQLFDISYAGKNIRYQGIHVSKRGLPKARDFVILKGGESYKALIDLSSNYDLSKPGTYSVSLDTTMQFASLADGSMLWDSDDQAMPLLSSTITLKVNGGLAAPPQAVAALGIISNGVSYDRCDTNQTNIGASAITAARNYSEVAKNYLASNITGPRYTTWFGTYSATRYATVSSNFSKIDTAMDQSGGQVTLSCYCDPRYSSAFAYVNTALPYEIHLCSAFWSAPVTGTDSRAGTLIHEMSHFDIVANTDDLAYGQANAKRLAKQPTKAIRNADSHEYFAENNPAQN